VFITVGFDRSIPKRMGILTGRKAHILINLGISSPVSLTVEELTM
jgi:hypothetical protein